MKKSRNEIGKLSYFVAESMEFQTLGKVYHDIPTIEEAYNLYKSIPNDKKSMGKGIGIQYTAMDDIEEYHILSFDRIDELEYAADKIKYDPEILKAILFLNRNINGQAITYREIVDMVYRFELKNNIADHECMTRWYSENGIEVSVAKDNISDYMICQKAIEIIEENVLASNSRHELIDRIAQRPIILSKNTKDVYSIAIGDNVLEEPFEKLDDATYSGFYEDERIQFNVKDIDAFYHNNKTHYIKDMSFMKQNVITHDDVTHGEELSEDDKKKECLLRGITNLMDSKEFMIYCDTMNKLMYNNYSPANCSKILEQFIFKYFVENNIDFLTLDNDTLINKIGEALNSDKKPSFLMGYEAWKQYGRKVTGKNVAYVITAPNYINEFKGKGSLLKIIKGSINKQLKNQNIEYGVFKLGNTDIRFLGYRNGLYDIMIKDKVIYGKMTEEKLRKFLDNEVIGKVPNGFSSTLVYDVKNTETPEYLWLKNGFSKSEIALDNMGEPISRIKGKSKEYKIINSAERISRFSLPDINLPDMNNEKMKLLFSVLQSVSENNGVPMSIDEINKDGVKGFFSHTDKCIVISDKLNDTEKVVVGFHELAHSIMHYQRTDLEKELKEVQAEAVAYMTAQNFGIETQTSSFNYIAGWSSGRELKELNNSLNVILQQSKSLTHDIQKELALRNYSLQLEPIVLDEMTSETMNNYDFETISKDKMNLFMDWKTNILQQKEAAFAKLDVLDNVRLKAIVKDQISVFESQLPSVYIGIKGCQFLANQSCDNRTKLKWLESLKEAEDNLYEMDKKINELSHEYIEHYQDLLHEHKHSLKDRFVNNRKNEIRMFIKSTTNEKYKKLSELEIDYISKSDYLYRTYGYLVETDLEHFMNASLNQIENIQKVHAKNNSFLEIISCENWTEKCLFMPGTVGHPKNMNSLFKKYESLIVKYKEEDASIPYHKCCTQLFTPNSDMSGYDSLELIIDLGNGYQKDLSDFIAKLQECNSGNLSQLSNIKECYGSALLEKPRNKIREAVVLDKSILSFSDESKLTNLANKVLENDSTVLYSMQDVKSFVHQSNNLNTPSSYNINTTYENKVL